MLDFFFFSRRDFIPSERQHLVLNCTFSSHSLNYTDEFKSGTLWDGCHSFDGFINKSWIMISEVSPLWALSPHLLLWTLLLVDRTMCFLHTIILALRLWLSSQLLNFLSKGFCSLTSADPGAIWVCIVKMSQEFDWMTVTEHWIKGKHYSLWVFY